MSAPAHRRCAFTLVELLVVIGIIAVLIGILLPTLKRARDQANTVVCAAQMRNIVQGLLVYAAENKGSMPYSFAWARTASPSSVGPISGNPALTLNWGTGGFRDQIWAAGFYWTKTVSDQGTKSGEHGMFPLSATITPMPLSKVFVCPVVANDGYYGGDVINSYGFNPVILVNRPFELAPNGALANYRGCIFNASYTWSPGSPNNGGTFTAIAPAKLSQLYSDNAVIWDTQVVNGSLSQPGALRPSMTPANVFGGFGMSGIDGGQLAEPQKPWQRYRNANTLPLTAPWEQYDKPIIYPTKRMERVLAGAQGPQWVNVDPYNGYMAVPDQMGNARYRHGGNTVCNVAFADASVRGLKVNLNRVAYLDKIGDEVAQSEFLRSYLLIKKPGGLPQPQQSQVP